MADTPIWPALSELLTENSAAQKTARTVIETDLTPTGGDSPDVRHYLVVPGAEHARTEALLLAEDAGVPRHVTQRLTAVRTSDLPDFVAMVHLYRLSVEPPEEQP